MRSSVVQRLADEKLRNARSIGHSDRERAKRVCEDTWCREVEVCRRVEQGDERMARMRIAVAVNRRNGEVKSTCEQREWEKSRGLQDFRSVREVDVSGTCGC